MAIQTDHEGANELTNTKNAGCQAKHKPVTQVLSKIKKTASMYKSRTSK